MKERVYIGIRGSGDDTSYVIEYDDGNGKSATMAECWDYNLAEDLAYATAKHMLTEDGLGDGVNFHKAEGDRPEGWYRD